MLRVQRILRDFGDLVANKMSRLRVLLLDEFSGGGLHFNRERLHGLPTDGLPRDGLFAFDPRQGLVKFGIR